MQSLNTLIQIFQSFDEAIYIVDKNRKILYFNPIAEKITGFQKNEILGKFCQNNTLNHIDKFGRALCTKDCPLVKAMKNNVVEEHSIFLHHKEGHRVPVRVKTIPYIEDDIIVGGIEVFDFEYKEKFSVTYKKAVESLNYIDPLTGVFNRYFYENELENIIKENNYNFDLLFIDVDNFKQVNDTLGHLEGDFFLKVITNTIKANITRNDYVVRYGGDEFLLLLDKSTGDAVEKAELIRTLVANSMRSEFIFTPTVSIGIRSLSLDETLVETITYADKALYKAKATGKNKIVISK